MSASNGLDGIAGRILIADDLGSVRNALYALLEGDGYEVLAAANGSEALSICRRSLRPIELLVTDYQMPAMSGIELAGQCAAMVHGLPVLYMSGRDPDENLRGELMRPRRAFVPKPFRAGDLLKKVREMLLASTKDRMPPASSMPEAPRLIRCC